MSNPCKNFSSELDVSELESLANKILKSFDKGVIILQGDLASGKTTLTKAISKALNKDECVTSPTFSLMSDYDGLRHYDLYMSDSEQIMQNGLFESFFEDILHIVEWGDERLIEMLKKYEIPVCVVKISNSPKGRKYEVSFA